MKLKSGFWDLNPNSEEKKILLLKLNFILDKKWSLIQSDWIVFLKSAFKWIFEILFSQLEFMKICVGLSLFGIKPESEK